LTHSVGAPAKINLALHVTGQRADGYHLLDSLVVFTGLGDTLAFETADADGFVIDGPYAGALAAEAPDTNLVTKARQALRTHCESLGHPCPAVLIRLTKNLPIASGMGGGSSDAAAALRGLAEFWKVSMAPGMLAQIGLSLGADVPMCLLAKPLFAKGIGEEISLASPFPALHLVLVNPGVEVSTPAVFKALSSKTNKPLSLHANLSSIQGLCQWLAAQRNDLQNPAMDMQPVIRDAIYALSERGALVARMSGSGATCFGIFPSAQAATSAAKAISERHTDWFVRATQSGGS
jgi:4-diphosphocytidyl-2-C-methyl-D-erythritol kinase